MLVDWSDCSPELLSRYRELLRSAADGDLDAALQASTISPSASGDIEWIRGARSSLNVLRTTEESLKRADFNGIRQQVEQLTEAAKTAEVSSVRARAALQTEQDLRRCVTDVKFNLFAAIELAANHPQAFAVMRDDFEAAALPLQITSDDWRALAAS